MKINFRNIILLLFLFSIFSCKENNDIKIAYVATLTGRNSESGVLGRKGAELAVRELNENGGINGRFIQLIVRDDKFNADTALYVDSTLISEGIKFFIAHTMSSVITKPTEYINDKEVIFLSPTVSTETLSEIDDNFLRIVTSNKGQAVVIAKHISESGFKNLGILYETENLTYSQELLSEFERLVKKENITISIKLPYSLKNKTSFYDLTKQFIQNDIDALLVIAPGNDLAIICQNLMKQNYNIPIYGGTWSMTNDLIENGGKSVHNVYLAGYVNIFDPSKEMQDHISNFKNSYGIIPTFSSIQCYEAVMTLAQAIEKSNFEDFNEIKNTLLTSSFKGIKDSIKFNRFGDSDKKYELYIIEEGKFKKLH